MNRRALLAALLGAGVAACTRAAPRIEGLFEPLSDELRGAARDLNVFPGGGEFVAGRAQRVTLGLVGADGLPVEGEGPRAWIGAGNSLAGSFALAFRAFAEQEGSVRGFHVATLPFPPEPGVTEVLVEHAGHYGTAAVSSVARSRVVDAGARAIPLATPTRADDHGVALVCTREPACGMHGVSLVDALERARPIVLVVASPRFCTSRTCGPVVDEVLAVRARHRRATFIHAEPFRDDQGRLPSRTFTAWNLPSEPWTFVLDARGRVAARFEGPVVADEIARALA